MRKLKLSIKRWWGQKFDGKTPGGHSCGRRGKSGEVLLLNYNKYADIFELGECRCVGRES